MKKGAMWRMVASRAAALIETRAAIVSVVRRRGLKQGFRCIKAG